MLSHRKILSEVIRISKYSNYNEKKKRRETWGEQVDRVMEMHKTYYKERFKDEPEKFEAFNSLWVVAYNALKKKQILGSQRNLQFGGPPVLKNHARSYNCSASFCDRPRVFQEATWLLLSGAGTGMSLQRHHVAQLPEIKMVTPIAKPVTFKVEDSIEGWADAVGALLSSYFVEKQPFPYLFGKKVFFDFSEVRPAGSPISHCAGKAPGPGPLQEGLEKVRNLLDNLFIERGKTTTKLTPLNCNDILNHTADFVLSGGVRRSSSLHIFSKDDEEMLTAKLGYWWEDNPQRARSNNSVVLVKDETTKDEFLNIFNTVRESGEPGFAWFDSTEMVSNPCFEIGLYPVDETTGETGWGMCNLSEINMGKVKNQKEFLEACTAAAILGTIQAGYTEFKYLTKATQNVVERESLIGVSMTGMMSKPDISFSPETQRQGAQLIKTINEKVAKLLGINPAARTTCIKPSGTASGLLETSAGIHPEHSSKYIRHMQANKMEEPIKFFKKFNPHAFEEGSKESDYCISFVVDVPKSARTKANVTALDLLKAVVDTKKNWINHGRNLERCVKPYLSHNVSNTIHVRDHEWEEVGEFIYENRYALTGVSLISEHGDKDYYQAPYTTIHSPKEILARYGDASFFTGGLNVWALQVFPNIWEASTYLLYGPSPSKVPDVEKSIAELRQEAERKTWRTRAIRFAKKHFSGDLQKLTYCMKDITILKKASDLTRDYVSVPWDKFFEKENNVKKADSVACSGPGGCDIKHL